MVIVLVDQLQVRVGRHVCLRGRQVLRAAVDHAEMRIRQQALEDEQRALIDPICLRCMN